MNKDEKLSGFEIVTISTLLMVGTGILSLPRFLIEASEVDTWLIILSGGIILAIVAFIYGYIISRFPGKGYFEILSITLTRPIAYILSTIYIIYIIILMGLNIRIFAETLKGSLFPMTPIEIIILAMILTGGYGARLGLETLGRFAKLLFLVMTPVTIIMFSLACFDADFSNLLPIFKISFEELAFAVPRVFYSFIGFDAILILGMFLYNPQDAKKTGPTSVALVTFLYLFINTVTLAKFGAKQTLVLVWPTLNLIRSIDIPLAFIEDMTSIGASLWVFSVFMSYLPNCMANSVLLGQMTGCRENNFFSVCQLPLIYLTAMLPSNITHIYVILDGTTKYLGPLFLFIVPTLILIVMGMKGLKNKVVKSES